jgi:hypothetical protein
MLASATGSLVIIGLNTPTPQVFWRGQKLNHVVGIRAHSDPDDDSWMKLRVTDAAGLQEDLYAEMEADGVSVKKVGA